MTDKQAAAAGGFAFVAMWVATSLGYAVLCLIGAAVFYLVVAVRQGELDLAELQGRLGPRSPASPPPSYRPSAMHRTRRRARVQ